MGCHEQRTEGQIPKSQRRHPCHAQRPASLNSAERRDGDDERQDQPEDNHLEESLEDGEDVGVKFFSDGGNQREGVRGVIS